MDHVKKPVDFEVQAQNQLEKIIKHSVWSVSNDSLRVYLKLIIMRYNYRFRIHLT